MHTVLLVGLGNPGASYRGTRHNLGAAFVRAWVAEHSSQLVDDWHAASRCQGDVAVVDVSDGVGSAVRVTCLLPTTGMNASGDAVAACLRVLRTPVSACVVVHDDVELAFGAVRSQVGGSAAGHNGVRSIYAVLGTQDLYRVRLGVGRPPEEVDLSSFVLGKFSDEERLVMAPMFQKAGAVLTELIEQRGQ